MDPEKLAYMANQIGRFFASQPHDKAVAGIEDHILKFWDRRMRDGLHRNLQAVTLDPLVREAMERLPPPSTPV
jgi:formate dehydrogenase subunit delta